MYYTFIYVCVCINKRMKIFNIKQEFQRYMYKVQLTY